MPREYKTIKDAALTALQIQDASNLQAVILEWGEMQRVIREDTKGGRAMFVHPVQILMMSKVASLMQVNADCIGGVKQGDEDLFVSAYRWASAIAQTEDTNGREG